jgi:ATP-dependent DNA ligase
MKKKDRISEPEYQGRLESLLKKRLQHGTAAVEVTRDRDQKAESAEKESRKKFWVHEIKHDGFRLMVRPAALSTR